MSITRSEASAASRLSILGPFAGARDGGDQLPSPVGAPLGPDLPRSGAGFAAARDLHGLDLERRYGHQRRLAPVGLRQVERAEQPGIDDLDALPADGMHKPLAADGLADLERCNRLIAPPTSRRSSRRAGRWRPAGLARMSPQSR